MSRHGKPVYVLGAGLSHDGAACLMKDGRVCVAIEKERLTRRKHDGGNDTDAVAYCLDAEGITIDQVDLLVQNANFSMFARGNGWFRGPRAFTEHVRTVTISHHLAHAYSSIGTSPFEAAAVFVVDGCGNAYDESMDRAGATIPVDPLPAELGHLYFEKDSYYAFQDERLTSIYKDYSPFGIQIREYPMCPPATMHSIGGVYAAASKYALFGLDDPGKLMGLAPYGRAGAHAFEVFDLRDGRVQVNYDWMEPFNRPARSYEDFKEHFQYYADIAFWIQREVERALLYVINHRYEQAPFDHLAYSGGVALNAVANRRILKETKFRRIYIQPAAGDNGLALGCAYYGWMHVLGRERVRHSGSTCFGKPYASETIDHALAPHAETLEVETVPDPAAPTAALLAAGQTVGWFQGGSEFGPRALGHRSILADPRRADAREFINAKIKLREDFRPFAPSVALEDLSTYFDTDTESPYMILVAPVRPEWREVIPSVVHRDGSCRIQTVTAEKDCCYYALLRAFKELTGISILLNTSFNRRGMPIVETPQQALDFYLSCPDLDILVLHDRLIRRRPVTTRLAQPAAVPRTFEESLREALVRRSAEARRIGAVFHFKIAGTRQWTVDLANGEPGVFEGIPARADVTIEMTDVDLAHFMADPAANGRALYKEGKLRLDGNVAQLLALVSLL